MKQREWRVVVNRKNVGDIGSVKAPTKAAANAAALSHYGEDATRPRVKREGKGFRPVQCLPRIYTDDDFDVRPA